MKNEIRLALLCMAAAAVPAFAQNSPLCGSTNLNQRQNAFTIVNPAPNAVNQQCFITVLAPGVATDQSRQYPASHFVEGSYVIELVGGGGGGGGGGGADKGGGGGGAGAAPSRTVQYLSPGVYKLTLGTGGHGGSAYGGRTGDGNPTSMTNAATGQLIAGFAGADVWTQRSQASGSGRGGIAKAGGSTGGSGGDSGARSEERAQTGGMSQTAGFSGRPGQAGGESGRTGETDATRGVVQANAGGGGGASMGSGSSGDSADSSTVSADGSRGGHGLIRLTLQTAAAPAARAPAFVEQQPAAAPVARPMRRDRN